MNEEELIRETRKLIGRWDNIRIVGQGWAGDTRRGFQFNPIRTTSPEGTAPVTPSGACCPPSGDCFISTQAVCAGGGGIYQGDSTTCVPDPCTPDTGACCVDSDCSIESESDCIGMGGVFQGAGTTCSPNPCPPPTGACCVGTDCSIETESDCTGMGGTYHGDDTVCDPNPCITLEGACCEGTDCHVRTAEDCAGVGGVYQGDGTDCDPNPCPTAPCCGSCFFPALDGSGRKFKTLNATWSGHIDFGGTPDVTADFSGTTSGSCDGDVLTCFCSGSGSSTDGGTVTLGPCSGGLEDSFCGTVTDLVTGSCSSVNGGTGTFVCQHYPATCPAGVLNVLAANSYTITYDCVSGSQTYHADVAVTLSDECDLGC